MANKHNPQAISLSPGWELLGDGNLIAPLEQPAASSYHFIAFEGVTQSADGHLSPAYTRVMSIPEFSASISSIDVERNVLRDTIRNLWQVYRFNQYYIGFLAGGVSKQDFAQAADKYACEPRNIEKTEMKAAFHIIYPLICDDEITSKDVAVALNVDPNQLELAIG